MEKDPECELLKDDPKYPECRTCREAAKYMAIEAYRQGVLDQGCQGWENDKEVREE